MGASESSPFELLDETVDAAAAAGFLIDCGQCDTHWSQPIRARLPELRHRTVVADEEGPAGLPVSGVLPVFRDVALVPQRL